METVKKYDFVCLTETFLTTTLDDSYFEEYDKYYVNAKKNAVLGRPSGGILVLIRKSFKSFVTEVPNTIENVAVFDIDKALFNTDLDIFWFCVYIPPSKSTFWSSCNTGYGVELIENCIIQLNELYSFHTLVTGDLNSRTASENCSLISADLDFLNDDVCFPRRSRDRNMNMFGRHLLEICDVFDIVILNGLQMFGFDEDITFIGDNGESTVDYFLISSDLVDSSLLNSLSVINCTESDHLPVVLTLNLVVNMVEEDDSKYDNTTNENTSKRIWDSAKEPIFLDALRSESLQYILNCATELLENDVDKSLELFASCFNIAGNCMVKTFNRGSKNKHSGRWFDSECKKAKVTSKRYLEIFRQSRDRQDRDNYVSARNNYENVKKCKRRDAKKVQADKLSDSLKNSKDFWKEASEIGCGKRKNKISERIDMCSWLKHFQDVLQVEEQSFLYNVPFETETNLNDIEVSMLDHDISVEDVTWALGDLKLNKACGTDEICAEMLKCGSCVAIPFLTKLFNSIFSKGIYPSEWSKAIVVPIHKKGSLHDVDNYRGISLLSIISKCYTKVLNKRLTTWLDSNHIISECQAGFRKCYSTVDQIFNLNALIQRTLAKKGRKLYVAFVDFKKAFDSVRHGKLFECLIKTGVKGKFLEALKAMYSSLVSCIRVNDVYSDFFECPVGVRQGCVLSPTLFSIFINQLANHMNEAGRHGVQMLPGLLELFILLFADDVALLSLSPVGLQNQLNILENFCSQIQLEINVQKTKIMVFRKGGVLSKHEQWYLYNEKVEIVNQYCYLGYIFTPSASPKIGTSQLVKKSKKAMIALTNAFKHNREMTREAYFKIFDGKILPILTYASEIWGVNRLDNVEKIHLQGCKSFLGVPIQTPNKMVYGDLGRHPLFIKTYISALKYWLKLLRMHQDRLPYQAYRMLLTVDASGGQCWVSLLKNILCKTGFMYVWFFQGVGDENCFLALFQQRLTDMYIQEWSEAMKNSERHQQYLKMKESFNRDNYLVNIDRFYFRACVSKARFNMLPLNGNINRFNSNLSKKMCPFCLNVIEDEEHFMFDCPMYVELRDKFLHTQRFLPLHVILSTKSKNRVRSIANYIVFALRKRSKLLYN
jgi:hypothetical protein